MKVVNYKQLKLNLKYWLDSVVADVGLIINQKNKSDLVLISLQEYNSLVETDYLLFSRNRDVLLSSIDEIKNEGKELKPLIEYKSESSP